MYRPCGKFSVRNKSTAMATFRVWLRESVCAGLRLWVRLHYSMQIKTNRRSHSMSRSVCNYATQLHFRSPPMTIKKHNEKTFTSHYSYSPRSGRHRALLLDFTNVHWTVECFINPEKEWCMMKNKRWVTCLSHVTPPALSLHITRTFPYFLITDLACTVYVHIFLPWPIGVLTDKNWLIFRQ